MSNPFFSRETTEAFEVPSLPFMSMGDPAQMQAAADLSGWLYEVGYVGSDESVDNVVTVFGPFQEAYRQFSDQRGIGSAPYESNGAELDFPQPSPRELAIGTAAIYGWKEPEEPQLEVEG